MQRFSFLQCLLLLSAVGLFAGTTVAWVDSRTRPAALIEAPGENARSAGPKPEQGLDEARRGWERGKGWGWIWGKDDEIGSLNALTDESRAAALKLASRGEVYDLGLTYSRRSYKWPGHCPGEIITFRSPDGIRRMNDADSPPADKNADLVFWHSAALFISDNVGTQIDGLGHITAGADDHWYNGFKESEWGGDWGPRKCDAATIPPIVARGVLIDVAAWKQVDALPGHTTITTRDLQDTLAWEGVTLQLGDVVLVRTGTGHYWGEDGADHRALSEHDSAGPDLEATRWLVEDQGAVMVGSDTSGYEVNPPPAPSGTIIPVHRYLLVDQGVHIGEFHYLEGLSKAKVYTFCYTASVNKIRGAAAGFTLRPLALR